MHNLRQFIEQILTKRQAQKPKLEAAQQDLRDLGQHLACLRQLATETSTNDDATSMLRQLALSLSVGITNLQSQVNDNIARTANLLSRFGKNTINIGVAGKTGMGKSTFLQAITGLNDQIIPTSAGEPCTGAKSKILHHEGEPHAVAILFGTISASGLTSGLA